MRRLTTFLAALLLAIGLAGALLVLFISLPIHERPRGQAIALAMPEGGLDAMPQPLEPGRRYAQEAAADQPLPRHRLDGHWRGPAPDGGLVLRRLDGPAGEFLVPLVIAEDGSFTAGGLIPGRYRLEWRDATGAQEREELVVDRDLILPALGRPARTASGMRLLAPDGRPLAPGAQVLLWSTEGRFVRTSTDDDGRIGLEDVAPGEWSYEVRGRVGDAPPRRWEGHVEVGPASAELRLGAPVNEG
ncbi:MAG: carboxypeptidase-like regulatory domain-containing protein [Planctomycetota bacterium]